MMEEVEKENRQKLIKNICGNYRQVEESIVNQLYLKNDFHGTTIGTHREEVWQQVFEMIIPKKFVLEHSAFIIDSCGHISHEVDLIVMDQMYTPFIFSYGSVKFIPIEAVAVVVECKSTSANHLSINKWSDSIDALQTSQQSIARLATVIATEAVKTQKSTRPIKILCSLQASICETTRKKFDFILDANQEEKKIKIKINENMNNLEE